MLLKRVCRKLMQTFAIRLRAILFPDNTKKSNPKVGFIFSDFNQPHMNLSKAVIISYHAFDFY